MNEQTENTTIEETKNEAASVVEATVKSKNDLLIPISIVVAGILIAGSVLVGLSKQSARTEPIPSGGANPPSPEAPVVAVDQKISAQDVILGDPNAPVSVIEYGDYQCPFCVRFHEQVAIPLRDTYIKEGKVKMAFRSFQFLGPESIATAEAVECAKDQNKFWAYHDIVYAAESKDGQEGNGNLNRALFLKLAGDLKLNTGSFTSCLDTHKHQKKVQSDTASAQQAGVNSTPTSFVNGQKVPGALPYEQFVAIIESQLKAK